MRKGTKLIKSKPITKDGIKFASRLELFMYELLKQEGLSFKYEPESFAILDSFYFDNNIYAAQSNGKGDFINRGNKTITGMKYTPDFIVKDNGYYAIIETKGFVTTEFAQRFKLFLKRVHDKSINVDIFVPRNQTQCKETLKIILNNVNNGN